MAYGEIHLSDVTKLNSMFIRIAQPPLTRDQRNQSRIDFLPANHCIEMLTDIQRELERCFPSLTKRSWHRSTTGYSREEPEKDGECIQHSLSFGWWKKGLWISFGLSFPQDRKVDGPSFYGYFWDEGQDDYYKNTKLSWQGISGYVDKKTGCIDREKIVRKAKALLENWAI
jgi:hypothetical protein